MSNANNDDLLNLDSLPDMDESKPILEALDSSEGKIAVKPIEKKPGLKIFNQKFSSDQKEIEILIDMDQFDASKIENEQQKFIQNTISDLAKEAEIGSPFPVTLQINDGALYFKGEYVGDMINQKAEVYYNLLGEAMAKDMVKSGIAEEYELGKYRFSDFTLNSLIIASALIAAKKGKKQ